MRGGKLILGFLFLFLINFVSAYTVQFSPNQVNSQVIQGQSTSVTVNYIVTNYGESSTAFITTTSFPSNMLTSNTGSVIINANTTTSGSFVLTFNSNGVATGNYSAWITFGTSSIFTSLEVKPIPNTCALNPSLVSYSQAVQANTIIPLSKITFNPTGCTGSLVLTSSNVLLEGGVISSSGVQKPLSISSIVSDGVNLQIDTTGLSSQTYSSKLKINAFSMTFEIPFLITVTQGTNPTINFSVNQLPTCSVSATQANLNVTDSLICTNVQPDVRVSPRVNELIEGIGVDNSNGQFTWYFKAKKLGVAKVIVDFYYLNAPVGNPFEQEIKIVSGSYSQGGTIMRFKFYPELYNTPDGKVIIQVIDNSSNNLIQNAQIYMDGVLLNNNTIQLQQNKNYELRASSYGYSDIVEVISLSQLPINFTIYNQYLVGDSLNFQTNPPNATILYDDEIITLPFQLTEEGIHTITASYLGYSQTEKNITVVKNANLISSLPIEEFKIGKIIYAQVDRNDSKLKIVYLDKNLVPNVLNETVGDYISVKADKKGTYEIYGDDNLLIRYEKKDTKWYFSWWFLTLCGIAVLIFLYLAFSGGSSSSSGGQTLSYGVGG